MKAPELRVAAAPLPRAVIALGWVSLLTDAASDMIYPLIPAFLLSLGGGAVTLGWLEGVAEAVGAVLKLASGTWSDRVAHRKPFVALGYGISALTRPMYAIVSLPFQAVLVRALDRVGKGLRGPPRDALIAAAVEPARRGHAFGYHRMMDNAGAVVGALAAFAMLRFLALDLRTIFRIALLPGLVAVLVALLFVREPPRERARSAPSSVGAGAPLPPAAIRYLAALAIFSLAGSGDMFLVLRLIDLGMDRSLAPLAWMALQLGKAVLNVPGGKAADRYGRKTVVTVAWVLYGASYAAFGLVHSWVGGASVLVAYALHYGLAEGGQRALLAERVPAEARGRAFGIQLAIEGGMVLLANVLFGVVYAQLGATVAFCAAASLAFVGAAVLSRV